MSRGQSYFISAGEHSGDLLAADLVLALSKVLPDHKASGIVGDAMLRAGVRELVHQRSLSVMGVVEVAKHLGEIRMIESFVLQKVDDLKPDFAILVDFPALHFRLAEQLKMRRIKVIQYVAPKVWAWGEGRLARLRRDFDLVLGVLPFEGKYFKSHGVNYQFVGSPHKDRVSKVIVNRRSLGLPEAGPFIGLLPGSRLAEISSIFPSLVLIKERLQKQHPQAKFLMPLADNLSLQSFLQAVGDNSGKWKLEGSDSTASTHVFAGIHIHRGMSLEVMSVADVAVVASGTATLECCLLETPMVVVYVMNALTYEVAKRKVKVPFVSLVNLLAKTELVKEFIQEFSIDDVVAEVDRLLADKPAREQMLEAFRSLKQKLKGDAAATAAAAICKNLERVGG